MPLSLIFYLSVMCLGEQATKTDGGWVATLFTAIGKIWIADEKHFDAVTGLRYYVC